MRLCDLKRELQAKGFDDPRVGVITDNGESLFNIDFHPQIETVDTPLEDGTLETIVAIGGEEIPLGNEPEPHLKLVKDDE